MEMIKWTLSIYASRTTCQMQNAKPLILIAIIFNIIIMIVLLKYLRANRINYIQAKSTVYPYDVVFPNLIDR